MMNLRNRIITPNTVLQFRQAVPQRADALGLFGVGVWFEGVQLESAPFTYAARSIRSASVNFSASVRASSRVSGTCLTSSLPAPRA